MIIKREKGYAVEKNTDVSINSANGLMHMDSSGAGIIREHSEKLSDDETIEFRELFRKLPVDIRNYWEERRKEHGWEYRKANLSALKLLLKQIEKEGRPFEIGEAVIDKEWSEFNPRIVIHAITMSYDPKTKERIKGSVLSVQTAIESALRLALSLDAKSISIPIACARTGYGINPEDSEEAVESAIGILSDKNVEEVILCYDNEETEDLLESEKNPDLDE